MSDEVTRNCIDCATGAKHEANYEARKAKKMSYYDYLLAESALGGICIKCKWAHISPRKAKKLAKKKGFVNIPIHSEDCFVPRGDSVERR